MKSEADHLRELEHHLRLAVEAATALGFYRNQSGWMRIAALLDQTGKKVREIALARRVN